MLGYPDSCLYAFVLMKEPIDSSTFAMDILRAWEWPEPGLNGMPVHSSMTLNEVVNRLAMDGVRRPEQALLSLLCQGKLIARGNYRWRSYQDYEPFGNDAQYEVIKPKYWQRLAEVIQEVKHRPGVALNDVRGLDPTSSIENTLQLIELGVRDCPEYEWEYTTSRFSYAMVSGDVWGGDYVEEWFSAWDIDVWPATTELKTTSGKPPGENNVAHPDKGGRPPAADWELAALDIAGKFYRGDFKPETIAEVKRQLFTWLSDKDLHPSDSIVHKHAKRIFDAFQAWESDVE